MTKVAINIEPVKNKVHHKRGNYYRIDGELYILSQANENNMTLVALDGGNRFYNPVHVEDSFNVTEDEFRKLGGSSYELIDEIFIKGK
jgi:hypothetical protein